MKTSVRQLLLIFPVLLCVVLCEPKTLWAEADFSSGCMVQYSPFYQKLVSAGVFDVPLASPVAQAEPFQILFLKAHLFHYSWDKDRQEQWQSPEETSRLFSGDCADKAIWLYTHLRRNGYQNVSLVIGRYSPSSKVLHMWVTYVDPSGSKLLLDPTIQRKPWKAENFDKRYYKPLYILSGSDCISL